MVRVYYHIYAVEGVEEIIDEQLSLIEKNFKSNDNLKDWVYVNNFKNTNEPIALSFKPGGGKAFKKDIEDIVDKLKNEVDKCVLVCSNCHSEIHEGLIDINTLVAER